MYVCVNNDLTFVSLLHTEVCWYWEYVPWSVCGSVPGGGEIIMTTLGGNNNIGSPTLGENEHTLADHVYI